MVLFPVRADQNFPTWGHTLGLLSFQFTGAIVTSFLRFVSPHLGGIGGSLLASAGMAVLYAIVAESKAPSSMSRRRYRTFLALMVSSALSLLGLLSVIFYVRSSIAPSTPTTDIVVPVATSFLLYFVDVWIGLLLGAKYMERRRRRIESEV